MIYRFNNKTITQLIHLLRGQEILFSSVKWEPALRKLSIPVLRKAEPNADRYDVEIEDCSSFSVQNPDSLETDLVQSLEISPSGHEFTLKAPNSSLSGVISTVKIAAVGEKSQKR